MRLQTRRRNGGGAGLARLLEQRDVRTVFQPFVHLRTGELVGYEALSRGPADTDLESPVAMLAAASRAERLAELDWICRAAAVRAAVDAQLHPSLSWFVNGECEVAGQMPPAELRRTVAAAADSLRVFLELRADALTVDPGHLLREVDRARADGWGIALDDVGGRAENLAMLPVVAPNVIKLDMRLLRNYGCPDVARAADAIRGYAEATGAVIVAKGVERESQVPVAQALGASYAQGWLFGQPGPLPAEVRAPRAPFPLRPEPASEVAGTPFEVVAAERATAVTEKRLLLPIARTIEHQAEGLRSAAALIGCFQDVRYLGAATGQRYARLAQVCAFAAVLAPGLTEHPAPELRVVTADAGSDRCAREWNVLSFGSQHAVALVARDLGDRVADPMRRFEYVLTHDRDLVLRAVRAVLPRIAAAGGGTVVGSGVGLD